MFWHVMQYIHHCHSNGVIFNHKKFVFCKMELEFSGFLLTADGIKPSPRIVEAIQKFPTPKNLTGIRSWFGLVNQVSYAFAQTELMAPFRDLLKKNQKFYWDSSLEDLFQQTKQKIIAQIENGIKMFDCSKATCLSTGARMALASSCSNKHADVNPSRDRIVEGVIGLSFLLGHVTPPRLNLGTPKLKERH